MFCAYCLSQITKKDSPVVIDTKMFCCQKHAEENAQLERGIAMRSKAQKAAQQSVHADAGESAASSELVHASVESTSQTVAQPTQRG